MSAAARKVADLPAAAHKHQGKLMAIKRSDNTITVTDQRLRKKVASVKIGEKINFKTGFLYYVKGLGIYEKAMARRGKASMKACEDRKMSESESESETSTDYDSD